MLSWRVEQGTQPCGAPMFRVMELEVVRGVAGPICE